MRDGFYLSTYIHIDPIAYLYNFHIRHDQNISLWKKQGNKIILVHHWELERITGLKRQYKSFYSIQQAKEFIEILLKQYDLKFDDLAGIIGTPQLDTVSDYSSIEENKELAYHSICHLYSSMLMDTDIFHNENIISLALDGGPDSVVDKSINDKKYYAGSVSRKGKVELFPLCSPGFLWTYLRKKYNLREGTLMALATASKSEIYCEDDELVKVYGIKDLKKAYEFINILDDRVNKIEAKDEGVLFNGFDPDFSEQDNRISMVSKIVQKMSIRILKYNIEHILEKYDLEPSETYVSISGGFGLNCPTNSFLMREYGFKGFLAPPCVNDAGISIGIALYYFNKEIPDMEFALKSSYFGDSDDSFDKILESGAYSQFFKSCQELDENTFVEDIQKEPVVWFDGRAEIGPRALGHRSLIVAPEKESGKDQLNIIKKRQWWRPVAPIILQEDMEEWFEGNYYSPFMLHTLYVREDQINLVPSICHLDNSARIQSLLYDDNPALYRLITAYKRQTGIPIICNTSLNDVGEPIINTIKECLNFALRKGIKVIYINQRRVELQNHDKYIKTCPEERSYSMNLFTEQEIEELKRKVNPFNLEEKALINIFNRPDLGESIDLTNKADANRLKLFTRIAEGRMGKIPVPGLDTKRGE
ncbi:MAG TPA: carbamoyltransferase [Lachnospiraceae bacterium]|nr:carbamoyltransferase C-terminal domain-containing protein [uncultured Lachnoclostridium sp.]HAU88421.1 carbamoyltransferase [Lachnospiraceae bacterium]